MLASQCRVTSMIKHLEILQDVFKIISQRSKDGYFHAVVRDVSPEEKKTLEYRGFTVSSGRNDTVIGW